LRGVNERLEKVLGTRGSNGRSRECLGVCGSVWEVIGTQGSKVVGSSPNSSFF
jgi:hypothetical protein